MTRVVHYINQFFAGIGGEEAAGKPPAGSTGRWGRGGASPALLGAGFEIVATVLCGDDYAAVPARRRRRREIDRPSPPRRNRTWSWPGPAFGSGRYGVACARVAAAADRGGDRGGGGHARGQSRTRGRRRRPVVAAGPTAREMKPSLERLAAAARRSPPAES